MHPSKTQMPEINDRPLDKIVLAAARLVPVSYEKAEPISFRGL